MRAEFCVYGEPQGKGRPRFSTVCGHVKTRTPEQTVIYENLVRTEYRSQSGKRFPDDAMLDVRILPSSTATPLTFRSLEEVVRDEEVLEPAKSGKRE